MDFKIPSSTPGRKVDGPAAAPQKTDGPAQVTGPSNDDPITQIAMEVVQGSLSSAEAVNQIIAHTMGEPMIAQAPAALRAELEQALKAMVAADPFLCSLTARL